MLFLGCNLWLQPFDATGAMPTQTELKRSLLGQILLAVQNNKKVGGRRVRLVLSRHVLLTCDHVAAVKGWTEAGEVQRWIVALVERGIREGSIIYDPTVEDYPALAARAAQFGGAEDAEDEAILRSAKANNAELVTYDGDLAGTCGRRGITVTGPTELRQQLCGH